MNHSKSALMPMGFLALVLLGSNSFAQEWRPAGVAAVEPGPALPPAPPAAFPPAGPPALLAAPLPALPSAPPTAPLLAPFAAPPAAPPANEPWLPEFLQRLPHPPDEMRSLYQPPETQPYSCPASASAPRPYFEADPLLDPSNMPSIGWFYSLDMQAGAPHIFQSLNGPVTAGSRPTDVVALPNRGLDWTIIPRIEVGYNLPSGFGGVALSYRFMGSSGNATIFGPDGPAPLHSRMDLNVVDLDYVSKEITPNGANDSWTMRWRFGVRGANLYYDSTLNQAPATAAAGTGILQQHALNRFAGAGPHVSVELTHQLGVPGLSILGRLDFASIFGSIWQQESETAFDPASPTGVSNGYSAISSSQTVPAANLLIGLNYQPPRWSNVHFFTGYQYENWWNVGRFSLNPLSRGDLTIQGFVGRFEVNY